MKTKGIKKVKVLSSSNSTTFENCVNDFLNDLENPKELQVSFTSTGKSHVAYVMWEAEELIPEDIRDEYILRGEKHTCGECPHWGGNKKQDGEGMRNTGCDLHITDGSIRGCAPACLWLYKELAKGGIVLHEYDPR